MMTKQPEPIALFLIGGNYFLIKNTKGQVICDVPRQSDPDRTMALAERIMSDYAKTGIIQLGPAPMKVLMRYAGYKLVDDNGDGEIIVEDVDGCREVWFKNQNHANPGLTYRGAHYEFVRSC
jgi:hypothetical protein